MPGTPQSLTLTTASEDDMTALGTRLAPKLASGDTILLDGPIGAGKSHLARAIIRACLETPEDIPSPTFTLVQTYQAPDFEIWHADLYRLGDSSELIELGLDEAMGTAALLIEWPSRLPPDMAADATLHIAIDPKGETRRLTFTPRTQRWAKTLGALLDD
ncbi:MAG: tRNA (adenosine(37)-N6)-threonylcarbamoyltransferase complex ATPase subunit type 1 TsaE [Silicimonas sp.]|nr:tRNA (adenosine(37)-N6)-threonylcarbamoyltransferase complex ATPase subunit type 1 TsaE [Silicimonas sp.]